MIDPKSCRFIIIFLISLVVFASSEAWNRTTGRNRDVMDREGNLQEHLPNLYSFGNEKVFNC